jgi:acetaldehyde dehydrogenase
MALNVAVIGSGNIGSDLMFKIFRNPNLKMIALVGIDPESDGLARARKHDVAAIDTGIEGLLAREDLMSQIDLIFDATSAKAHLHNAPLIEKAGKIALDLTPAAIGPYVVPPVNLKEHLEGDVRNLNMVTCGGQATIPIVAAIARVQPVEYGEIVATIASKSAGPGTRANIDEFTETTAHAIETVGGAQRGKAIIILNPAEPPMIMRDTIFCAVAPDADDEAIVRSVNDMVEAVQDYVPGYRLLQEPQIDDPSPVTRGQKKVSVFVEIEGAGDFLPPYAGNLDIMTAAATRVGERIATGMEATK